ncbi:hypothetical protein YC2023_002536 [Brassica napus]
MTSKADRDLHEDKVAPSAAEISPGTIRATSLTTDHYMEPAQHGVQDVLNISTEVHVFHRAILDLGRARLSLGGEKTKDGHAFSSGGPSGQSRKRRYLYPVHPSGSDESRHLDWMFGLLKKSKPQQDVYFPFKTVFEKEQLIFDKKQFASNEFDFVQKQKKRQNRCDDEKWVRSRDRPFTKAKRSNCDVPDQNELQTYASLEKMLHKAIHVVRQLKKKGNSNTSSAPKQQSNSSSISNSDLKTNVLSSDKSKAVKTTSKALSTRLSLGGEKTKDGHAFSSGGPSGQSRKRPYLYPVHPSGSDESRHLDWSSPFSVP